MLLTGRQNGGTGVKKTGVAITLDFDTIQA
jgi:hypothetical protein